jgi:hypothetical protein
LASAATLVQPERLDNVHSLAGIVANVKQEPSPQERVAGILTELLHARVPIQILTGRERRALEYAIAYLIGDS